jgi:hypothetical protein
MFIDEIINDQFGNWLELELMSAGDLRAFESDFLLPEGYL